MSQVKKPLNQEEVDQIIQNELGLTSQEESGSEDEAQHKKNDGLGVLGTEFALKDTH